MVLIRDFWKKRETSMKVEEWSLYVYHGSGMWDICRDCAEKLDSKLVRQFPNYNPSVF